MSLSVRPASTLAHLERARVGRPPCPTCTDRARALFWHFPRPRAPRPPPPGAELHACYAQAPCLPSKVFTLFLLPHPHLGSARGYDGIEIWEMG